MEVIEKIRLNDEQIEKLEAGEMLMIPATWDEFEEFLSETDYRIEYDNGHSIVMGLATIIHELISSRLNYLLTGAYLGKPFYVVGSNAGIRKDGRRKHHNGDVLVIKDKPVYQAKSKSIITNPYLIVEVLSESTIDYDLGSKRRAYEQIESVHEIVFIDPFDKEVLVCRRTEQPNAWLETTYSQPEMPILIDGNSFSWHIIFDNLPEE